MNETGACSMLAEIEEPDLNGREKALQLSVRCALETALKSSGYLFITIEKFGFDFGLFIRRPNGPRMCFIELTPKNKQSPKILQFTSSPIANSTKLNILHRLILFRDIVPYYRKTRKRDFRESCIGTVAVRHENDGTTMEFGVIPESGIWKRMPNPIKFQ